MTETDTTDAPRKRPRQPTSDPKYPRKRSVKACHVCRARKTKCDNVQPTCGFCASLNIPCSYDNTEKDHSQFDPASLEILRQLGQIITSQDELTQTVRAIAAQSHAGFSVPQNHCDATLQTQNRTVPTEWFAGQPESASTTPASSASVAAVRWFGILANDAPGEVPEDELLDTSTDGQADIDITPLQRATRIIDTQPEVSDRRSSVSEESLWQASESISLLDQEQSLFQNFLHRICSWLDLFDPARTFSTRVPHLAVRNAGLLNAILALSSYHQSLDTSLPPSQRPDQNIALQYYYQTLHYVQKAMRYSSYQNSQELMATTLMVSTYEMLRGSRQDWQQHLQGVFWILRSRQIEVETSSLERTGLAVQLHHCSRILINAHEPHLHGIQGFLKRQTEIQQSIEMVCGIGMTLTEDASSMLSSQCLFIGMSFFYRSDVLLIRVAGMFMQDPRQKEAVLDMLDSCQKRCGWPTPSLRFELEAIWKNPDALW
ncbi:unnamed protein product [Fusarium equiseti]|uniref:Zn(2)-C6 fungal-type domain-containing protein n=1 Tax=Fusarium equiseti TaxID=61235 RepID=A0A8J2IQH0_FUSEQ|nr:unnamed protein product [Fusarium equiseti]